MRTETRTKQNTATARVNSISPWHLTKIQPLEKYRLEVKFNDGTHGFVDMEALITGTNAGVFAKLRDKNTFNKVYIEDGAATWPGEIDIAPDNVYVRIKHTGRCILK